MTHTHDRCPRDYETEHCSPLGVCPPCRHIDVRPRCASSIIGQMMEGMYQRDMIERMNRATQEDLLLAKLHNAMNAVGMKSELRGRSIGVTIHDDRTINHIMEHTKPPKRRKRRQNQK